MKCIPFSLFTFFTPRAIEFKHKKFNYKSILNRFNSQNFEYFIKYDSQRYTRFGNNEQGTNKNFFRKRQETIFNNNPGQFKQPKISNNNSGHFKHNHFSNKNSDQFRQNSHLIIIRAK